MFKEEFTLEIDVEFPIVAIPMGDIAVDFRHTYIVIVNKCGIQPEAEHLFIGTHLVPIEEGKLHVAVQIHPAVADSDVTVSLKSIMETEHASIAGSQMVIQ